MTTKSRPIIMSSDSVRAILENRKSQTRRVMKPQPKHHTDHEGGFYCDTKGKCYLCGDENGNEYESPFGAPGDRLWVREAFWIDRRDKTLVVLEDGTIADKRGFVSTSLVDNDPRQAHGDKINNFDDLKRHKYWSRKSPLFLPRWASRLTLEITNVRCERVQEIYPAEADDEGYKTIMGFKDAWDKLNAKRGYGWDTNPWVWVIEFKKIEGGDNE